MGAGEVTLPRHSLTVVMPAYNEEDAILAAVEDIQRHVLDLVAHSELVVIDDGSRDHTGVILDRLAEAEPRLRVIHQKNSGHGPALIRGMDHARGEFILLLDSDRQIPLTGFSEFWKAVQGHFDAAFGFRQRRRDPPIRLALTRLIRRVLRLLFGHHIADANVPFKLFPRSVWMEARTLIPEDTLAPSLFLALFIKENGLKLAEIPVAHLERATGEVSIKRWKLLSFCTRAFGQLIRFRRRLGHE